MTVKELKGKLETYSDDMEVIIFVDEGDPFYLKASHAKSGYICEAVDYMFFDPDEFTEGEYEGDEDFDGELEEVLVIL
jgi:hypothetical protein